LRFTASASEPGATDGRPRQPVDEAENDMKHSDVLIIGAGPTGLVLALWLTKLGVEVRVVDKTAEPGTTSRALAVHARTLELYRQVDLAEFVVEHGHKVPAVNLWVKGEPAARLPFETVGEDLTAYPFLQIFPQDQHEQLLIERLEKLGVAVERRTELMGFTDEGDRVTASLRGLDGHEEDCEATYIAGCDGARSLVRETLGTGFPGGTYRQVLTSPTSRRPVPRSTASCMSTSTRPTSLPSSPWPAKAGRV
jgi:2-polyprenyl-6-methoxyphenol hydroxylase-like FAD-dependent oxidoreductase